MKGRFMLSFLSKQNFMSDLCEESILGVNLYKNITNSKKA